MLNVYFEHLSNKVIQEMFEVFGFFFQAILHQAITRLKRAVSSFDIIVYGLQKMKEREGRQAHYGEERAVYFLHAGKSH